MPTYLSSFALEESKIEIEQRKKIARREIAEKIAGAKELGDPSENFEYQKAIEERGLNEAKIAELESIVSDCVVVESEQGATEIKIGTTFLVETDTDKKTFSMVGSSEADPLNGKISNESPIGLAFLGRKCNEVVHVQTPSGIIQYRIVQIL